jgi:serine-type D-Ala-D-Ala carboxypeptidase/endopeptidase (penicillin-binding protein 4)
MTAAPVGGREQSSPTTGRALRAIGDCSLAVRDAVPDVDPAQTAPLNSRAASSLSYGRPTDRRSPMPPRQSAIETPNLILRFVHARRFSALRCATLVLACAMSACHATPRPGLTPRSPAIQQLQRDLDAILTAPELDRGYWGVLVRSLADGTTLYARNEHRLLMPGSTLKIVTLAAAADRLGWNFAFETRLSVPSQSLRDGIVDGDLIVAGNGDPSIGGRDGPPPGVFRSLAEQLKAQGVRRIDGRVVGDDRAFAGEPYGAGWSWDDLMAGYASGIGALQFNENSVRATIAPGVAVGAEAIVTIDPPDSGLVVQNRVRTVAGDTATRVAARRLPGRDRLELSGTVRLGEPPVVRSFSVDRPTLFFVTALRRQLVDSGIDVQGPAVPIEDVDSPTIPFSQTTLAACTSAPLSSLASTMMKVSQNLYAETLVRTLGAATGSPTAEGGLAVVKAIVEAWGIDPREVIMADGSGLSRYSLITPEALVAILTHVDRDDRLRDAFESSLPVAGRDGTLAHRMQGSAAEGRVQAKTGSMSNVRALSGYLTSANGERLVFSLIANNFGVSPDVIDRAADGVLVRLAQFSRAVPQHP